MAVRKNILKLAKKISGSVAMLVKLDENAPEYKVLNCVVTDEMAEVALALELRKPLPLETIAKRCGKTLEETKKQMDLLTEAGVVIFHSENGVDVFELPVFVPGVMEKMMNNRAQCEKHPEIPAVFEEYARLRGELLSPKLPVGASPMRVIPIQSAIDGDSHSVPYEQVATILNKSTRFAVADCSCRTSRRLLGQGCGHLEKDMCLQLNAGAEYCIRTGRAREITREEAFEIVRKAEENGLMHSVPNIDGGETYAICNCCGCGCYAVRNAAYYNAPDMVRSNYVAQTDSEKCVACGQCVENCPVNALKLGQKLCEGTKPAKMESPRNHVWTKEHWNVNYRENREDVTEEGTAPCKTACPAHIAVQGYIKLAAQGRYRDALELIKKENPFPAVCGRICPRNCESACTRGGLDEPVAVDEIKKFIADQELKDEHRFVPVKAHDYGKPIAVIGAGPAGLSCAYYLAVDGYNVTVFEKEKTLGGMLTMGIPAFRLEREIVNAEIDILRELGVVFRTGVEVGKDVTLDELRGQGFEAFYIAIGAQGGRKLGLANEDAQGVVAGVDFLRAVSQGHSMDLSGKVVVVGGGNVAIDVARTAIREKVDTVEMYCLESREEMPALEEEIAEAEAESIPVHNGWGPKELLVENGHIKGIVFMRCISVYDENRRFAPQYDPNETITVDADWVLLSIGQEIQWGGLLDGSAVEFGRGRTAVADPLTYQTAQKDIFVGGDCCTGPKFAIDAIAAGKQGAISIHRFVWEGVSMTAGRDRRIYKEFNKAAADLESFDRMPRQRPLRKKVETDSFSDDRCTFTEEQMKRETERCLGCGAVQLNQEMCIGCGQCTTKCKFDAIHLVKKYHVEYNTFEGIPLKLTPNMIKRVGKIAVRSVKDAVTGNE
ncbi:FAD-dependent oxidoreductase [uncultured Ruthenibacterium sp.]|uniref:FAD-dependent oxidoreductase n=1 Tax=uncultured Ruthenibacterium sp. TaxID=1905347 RepID=UPI00349E6C14